MAGLSGCYKARAVTTDVTAISQTTVMCRLDPSLLAKAVRERTVTSAAYQLAHVTHEVTGIIWPGNYGCYKASHRATRYEYSTTGTNAVLQTADTNPLPFSLYIPTMRTLQNPTTGRGRNKCCPLCGAVTTAAAAIFQTADVISALSCNRVAGMWLLQSEPLCDPHQGYDTTKPVMC